MRDIGPLGVDMKTPNKWENICLCWYVPTLIFPIHTTGEGFNKEKRKKKLYIFLHLPILLIVCYWFITLTLYPTSNHHYILLPKKVIFLDNVSKYFLVFFRQQFIPLNTLSMTTTLLLKA